MHLVPSFVFRRLSLVVLAPLALLGAAGCQDPVAGDDIRVVWKSPGYLRQAWIYSRKDPAADAEVNYQAGDHRLCMLDSLGAHYPGCEPGVGEKYARRYGSILLPKTSGAIAPELTAQEYYHDIAWNYASTYNHIMVSMLESQSTHTRTTRTTILDK